MVRPITPEEVSARSLKTIPPEVIEAFNELIAMNYLGGYAVITQEDAVGLILCKMPEGTVFNDDWLHIEEVYREAGWFVIYEQAHAGFNDSDLDRYRFDPRSP